MSLPVPHPLPPMEARTVEAIPAGEGWQYEPKWDGFRCLAFRDGDRIALQSKSEKPLARYFPDMVRDLLALAPKRFVLDGELVVAVEGRLSFDELLQRIHPAESRVKTLAQAHPAAFIVFDLLVDDAGRSLLPLPLSERRAGLERFAAQHLPARGSILLSPATLELAAARRWLSGGGGDLDGVICKRLEAPYGSGHRDAMVKVKNLRTADCVVGGFRYASRGRVVGSLLLGLYDEAGRLHHVGFTSSMPSASKAELTGRLEALVEPPGFTGRAPGGPSRWSTERSTEWEPLRPELVVEVSYDHVSGDRFRHGTRLLRERPDKSPSQCTMDQVHHAGVRPPLRL